jgi:hypothetical protein
MQSAIEPAKAHSIGAASVRNSGHFGTAFYFTRMAADAAASETPSGSGASGIERAGEADRQRAAGDMGPVR